MNKLKLVVSCVGFLFLETFCHGQVESKSNVLGIGDITPSIKVAEWVKGKPVSAFEKGKVYVVEFGFIACRPCREGIPHLTTLSNKYSENKLEVISIFVRDGIEQVESYIENLGDEVGYKVAVDGKSALMQSSWVQAAGHYAYPTVFLIDKTGRVAWITNNIQNLDQYVDQLIGGSFEPLKAIEDIERKQNKSLISKINKQLTVAKGKGEYKPVINEIEKMIVQFPEKRFLYESMFRVMLLAKVDSANDYARNILNNENWKSLEAPLVFKMGLLALDHTFKHPSYGNLAIAMFDKVIELSKQLEDRHAAANNIMLAYSYMSPVYFLLGNSKKGEEIMMKAIEHIPSEGYKARKNDLLNSLEFYKKEYGGEK